MTTNFCRQSTDGQRDRQKVRQSFSKEKMIDNRFTEKRKDTGHRQIDGQIDKHSDMQRQMY